MKTKTMLFMIALIGLLASCNDYPIDDNGLLITEKTKCYMSSFYLVGTDNQHVLVTNPTIGNGLIDTVACTVTAVAKFGTNLSKVKPYCGVTDDITVEPGMGKWIDFTTPKEYILVSGNRQIRKKYAITITVQQ